MRDSEAIGVAWRRRRGVDGKKKEKKETDFVSNRFFCDLLTKLLFIIYFYYYYYYHHYYIYIIIIPEEATWTFRQDPLRHPIMNDVCPPSHACLDHHFLTEGAYLRCFVVGANNFECPLINCFFPRQMIYLH